MTSDSEAAPKKIDFESVKKGDIFWEDSQYGSVQVEALTDAEVNGDLITFQGRAHGSKVTEFLANKTAMHYAPRLCTQPCYFPATKLDGSDGHKVTELAQSEAPSVDTTSLEQKITKLTLEIASKQKVISRLKAGTNVCQDCGRVLTRCENCERLWQT